MTECSICGLPMLHEGVEYLDSQLVHCGDGHLAVVSCDSEDDIYVRDAEPASEWVARMAHAFPPRDSRRDDVRAVAQAVRRLEDRASDERGVGRI